MLGFFGSDIAASFGHRSVIEIAVEVQRKGEHFGEHIDQYIHIRTCLLWRLWRFRPTWELRMISWAELLRQGVAVAGRWPFCRRRSDVEVGRGGSRNSGVGSRDMNKRAGRPGRLIYEASMNYESRVTSRGATTTIPSSASTFRCISLVYMSMEFLSLSVPFPLFESYLAFLSLQGTQQKWQAFYESGPSQSHDSCSCESRFLACLSFFLLIILHPSYVLFSFPFHSHSFSEVLRFFFLFRPPIPLRYRAVSQDPEATSTEQAPWQKSLTGPRIPIPSSTPLGSAISK